MIELKNVSYGYEKKNKIIKEINQTINQGQFICVIGKNGSRKINSCQTNCGNYKTNRRRSFGGREEYKEKRKLFIHS